MKTGEREALVRKFWQLFSDQKWAEARKLLAENFTCDWPQSRERMSADNFVHVNRIYPGNHRIEVLRAHEIADTVITTVWIEADTGQKTFAHSYFQVDDEKILSVQEYWAELYAAPMSRREWVELY